MKRILSSVLCVLLMLTSVSLSVMAQTQTVTVNLVKGDTYTLPADITWDENYSVDTTKVGYQLFYGTKDGDNVIYRVNVGEWKVLMEETFESYNVETEGKAALNQKSINGGKIVKNPYSNGSCGVQILKDGANTVMSLGKDSSSWSDLSFIPTVNLKDDFKISLRIKVKEFDAKQNADTGSNIGFGMNLHNTSGFYYRLYKDTKTTVSLSAVAYKNQSKSANIPVSIIPINTDSNGIVSTDWADFDLVAHNGLHSLYVNDTNLFKDEVWANTGSGGVNSVGVTKINIAKSVNAASSPMITYFDDLTYSQAVYPKGDVPQDLTAKVETGADGNGSVNFNLAMSDGSNKSCTANYTVDTSSEKTVTVQATAEGFNFTVPVEVTVENAPVVVESIDCETEKTVYVGDEFSLPASATAQMSDGSTKEVGISWSAVPSTQNRGVFTFTGIVADYDDTITYTLTVKAAVKVNEIIGKDSTYTLPEKYEGETIDWGGADTSVDTSYLGIQTFAGELPDGSELIYTVNIGESEVIFEENMETYTVGGTNPDYGDRADYGDAGGLYLGNACSIEYENGESGNKVAKINETSEWGQFDMIAPTVTSKSYVVTGRVKLDTNQTMGELTRLIVYNNANPQQEVCGLFINVSTPGILRIGNSVNISVAAGANPDAYSTKEISIPDYNGEWVDLKIFVDEEKDVYDIYANGKAVRLGCPLNLNGLTNAAFKSIRIKRYGTTNDQSFDDFKVTQYVWIDDALPESLNDSVVSGADADRVQSISLKMSDGTTRQFDVKYTIDPTVSGIQNVDGSIDGFTAKIPVAVSVDARSIVSIKEDSLYNQGRVYVGSDYVLPSTVTAVMSENDENGSNEKEMNVTWDGIADTSLAGVYTFNGTVAGYDGYVVFTLTVSDDIPVSAAPIAVTKSLNEAYTLPAKVDVLLESGESDLMEVNWMGSMARTDKAGEFIFTGYVIGYPPIGDDEGITVTLTLTVESSAVKKVNYNEGEEYFNIILKNLSELPAKVNCEYENGMSGFEEVVWDTSSVTSQNGNYAITGTLVNTNLAADFSGTVNAQINFYDVPLPALEDGLDTHIWDGPYGDYKFPLGKALRYEQYPSNNSSKFLCVQDPDNSENKVMRYENNPAFSPNDRQNFNALEMSSAKGGFLVADAKIRLPMNFGYTRFRLLTGASKEFCIMDLYSDKSIKIPGIPAVANAFPLEEWFRISIVANTTAQLADERTFDLYINGIYLCTAPWYQEPSETNGVGKGVRRFDFRNDTDENFIMYVDDVKLYFLSDLMSEAFDAISKIPTSIQENTITLPSLVDGAVITWESSDDCINVSTGAVTRPAYNEQNKTVTLTATLSKSAGCFTATDTKAITVKVNKVGATDNDIVNAALSSISLPAETSTDISLRTSYRDVRISWASSNSSVIDNLGRVYPVNADTTVTLTATAECGGQRASRTFTVRVIATGTMSDIQKVRQAMNSVSLPAETSTALNLPANIDGVSITWVSKSLSVITSEGALISNRNSDANATLTATFTYGDVIQTKDYTVLVRKSTLSGPVVESSGGGGGGGSKSDYVQQTPAVEEKPTVTTGKFGDLGGYDWAKESIEALSDMGIINGVGANMFAPANNIKREEFAAMMVRLAKIELVQGENAFADVNENDWFMAELNTAFANGIINGMGDGNFGAGRNITRQDMAVILLNLAKRYGIDTSNAPKNEFKDYSNISDYAAEAVNFLASKGIINGSEGNMLPQRMATRAEGAKMIYEFIKVFDIENLSLVENALSENSDKAAQ